MKLIRVIIETDNNPDHLINTLNTHTKILHRKEVPPEDIDMDIRLPNQYTCGKYIGIIKYLIETEHPSDKLSNEGNLFFKKLINKHN